MLAKNRLCLRRFSSSISHQHNDNNNTSKASRFVRIGNVQRERGKWPPDRPELLATHYLSSSQPSSSSSSSSSSLLSHLQWMMKKDLLGQDMCLIGPPGSNSSTRRRLALSYAELVQREVQVVTITSDLTESDLKQRRELVVIKKGDDDYNNNDNVNNNLLQLSFFNAAPVDAALHGRLLILDGLERASRNVLPTLNNLLEHRSMNLEDGRLLVSSERYQELVQLREEQQQNPSSTMILPVHPDFRVIATAVPAPLGGQSLDPPLRSRFQMRRVDEQDFVTALLDDHELVLDNNSDEEFTTTEKNRNKDRMCISLVAAMETVARGEQQLDSTRTSSSTSIWPFPTNQLAPTLQTIHDFPQQDIKSVLMTAYPIGTTSDDERIQELWGRVHEASRSAWDIALEEIMGDGTNTTDNAIENGESCEYRLQSITREGVNDANHRANVTFTTASSSSPSENNNENSTWLSSLRRPKEDDDDDESVVTISVPCGEGPLLLSEEATTTTTTTTITSDYSSTFCLTEGLQTVLTSMLQSHAVDRDILLVSPPGESKSATANYFAALLGYKSKLVHAYSEMTTRDLFLRRITDPVTGETAWESSALLQAIQDGDLCVLDHAHKLRPDVLASFQSLCLDRDFHLSDGRRVLRKDRAQSLGLDNNDPNVICVHPSFRLVFLASLNNKESSSWLTQDVMSMVRTIIIPPPSADCTRAILESVNPDCPIAIVDQLLELRRQLSNETAADCGVMPLSTRNLIRIVRRANYCNLHDAVCEVLVADLLPPTQRAALESVLRRVGIMKKKKSSRRGRQEEAIVVESDQFSIGDFKMNRAKSQRPEMVPSPKFFDIPSHVSTMKDLLQDWNNGERAFLLLGNQGVGKNMLVDRLCEIADFEREYIQLHRDSTIGQITLQPSLEDGKIVWKDSPLVRAATHGLSLVVDEADKAPTESLSVLKGLVEDGELLLGDGRRLSRHYDDGPGIIKIHPDFTLWVLANRPGYPFLGNEFFKQIGDIFSTRVVANPDLQSEIDLLTLYGPSVDPALVRSIAGSFAELRSLSDHGDIAYPYSAREAVAVVKHLEKYPDDDVVSALHNVLDFDSFDQTVYATLGRVFQQHGIPVEDYSSWREALVLQGKNLSVEYSGGHSSEGTSRSPPPLGSPKEGKWDENNEAHVGGNQWAGGTGGSDTAGLGGRGGPYRLDRGHRVHQISDEAKAQVSKEAARAARAMAQKALDEKLGEINMSETEWDMYQRFVDPIRKDIANLRAILNQVDSKQVEKGWIKRQSHGELDDAKLVDGVTGDKYIYKRRGAVEDAGPAQQPKRLLFVVDISGSMYRFNGYDSRLFRCLEATNLIMESFDGMQNKFDYSIVGHSGDSPCVPLVDFGKPPINERQRMKVLQTMIAHSQYCASGDYTLEAMEQAIDVVVDEEERNEPVVIAISDANLERYGIQPRELGKIMQSGSDKGVKSHCIFIASFGREADEIKRELPIGRGHVCMETSELPRLVRNILAAQV